MPKRNEDIFLKKKEKKRKKYSFEICGREKKERNEEEPKGIETHEL